MQSAKEEFLAQLADPQRELIGAQQVADVRQAVQESGKSRQLTLRLHGM